MNAATEARRAYMKAWRAANKDKVKEHNRRYWERKAAKMADKEAKSNAAAEYVDDPRNGAAVKG